MGSKKGRKYHSWTGPVRAYMRCLAVRFWDRGFRGEKELAAVFTQRIPDWKTHFGDITDNALKDRADKARRNKSENPETHDEMKLYWERAGRDMATGKKWSSWRQIEAELTGASLFQVDGGPPPKTKLKLTPLEEVAFAVRPTQYAARSFVVDVDRVAPITKALREHGVEVIFEPVTP